MKNPMATIRMENGAEIQVELLPEAAPNTCASFIYLAQQGAFDHHAIQRIVPGDWVDVSYTAFGKDICKYLIPRESELHPEIEPLPTTPGCICMGGYEEGLAGGEFFFPLRNCPEHKGKYPVFGVVLSGMEEIYRLEQVPTKPVQIPGIPDIKANEPLAPEIIESVTVELFGETYPEPVKLEGVELPVAWQ